MILFQQSGAFFQVSLSVSQPVPHLSFSLRRREHAKDVVHAFSEESESTLISQITHIAGSRSVS